MNMKTNLEEKAMMMPKNFSEKPICSIRKGHLNECRNEQTNQDIPEEHVPQKSKIQKSEDALHRLSDSLSNIRISTASLTTISEMKGKDNLMIH